ncbi:hypothetical protein KN1_11440 [Stygiolobus caldivivus]|uniref:Uncharacterized protein n=1 Tax=Stygiolobus caldivivus TaxID=2824673 RepID=A0A8D5U6E6_9CREN|nr:hypothetical protein KN1_11440 [Stygiolobus caldivivus]
MLWISVINPSIDKVIGSLAIGTVSCGITFDPITATYI